ncbi:hypothetical protein C0J52_28226 [Blattella germanica]|nr:hypothetical protein C0J52_28226 [Blattella germanica]
MLIVLSGLTTCNTNLFCLPSYGETLRIFYLRYQRTPKTMCKINVLRGVFSNAVTFCNKTTFT